MASQMIDPTAQTTNAMGNWEPMKRAISQVLSTKAPLLAVAGDNVISSNLFYSASSTEVVAAEAYSTLARYTQSSAGTASGTSSFVIPNYSFLNRMLLYVEYDLKEGMNVNLAWLASAISSISILIGPSSTAQLTFSADSLFQMLMQTAETSEKRAAVLSLLGVPVTPPAAAATKRVYGVIPLACLFTSISNFVKIRPLPTDLLRTPVNITVNWSKLSRFAWATATAGGNSAAQNFANANTAFNKVTLISRDLFLSNQSFSLATQMLVNPQLVYNFPSIFQQSYNTSINGIKASDKGLKLPLQGLLNSDLLGLSVMIRDAATAFGTDAGTTPILWAQFMPGVSNMKISFNGQVFHWAYGEGNSIVQYADEIHDNFGAPYIDVGASPVIVASGKGTPLPFKFPYMNLCFKKAMAYSGMQNSIRFANQALTLEFDLTNANGKGVGDINLDIVVVYYYSGALSISQGSSYLNL